MGKCRYTLCFHHYIGCSLYYVVHISLYHGQMSLYPVLSSLYWIQLILCCSHIVISWKTSLYPVLSSFYWMQLILCCVYISLYHEQMSLYPVLSSVYWLQFILCNVQISLYHGLIVTLSWAFVIIPFDVFIGLGVLDIILWVNYLLFCLFDVFS